MHSKARIGTLLKEVFRRNHDPAADGSAEKENDFVFHMLDAEDDIRSFAALLSDPESHSIDDAERIVQALLYHAAGHISAAARTYDVLIEPFQQ